jgi:twitching motility protein PilI
MTASAASQAIQATRAETSQDQSRQSGSTTTGDGGSAIRSVARLGLLIGNQRLLVDLAEAGEIIAMPPVIVPVPLTRDWFLGVTNVRGSLFTVVDLRRFSGDGVTEIVKETRLLSLAPSLGFNVTLVVSKMLGLRNTASMTSIVNESPAHPGANWLGHSFADADGHIWRELSLNRLIATPDFLMVGR